MTTTDDITTQADATSDDVEDSTSVTAAKTDPEKTATDKRTPAAETKDASDQGKSISVRTLLRVGGALLVVVAVAVTIGVLSWRLHTESSANSDIAAAAANDERAEQIALDYATGAAEMNFQDPVAWRERLTQGTTPELGNRLTQAATSMEQLITPLQWTSTSQPITAKVESSSGGLYDVIAFVNVLTKNSQSPSGIESTATYKMTIDSNQDWMITEISGIDSALDGGEAAPAQPAPPATEGE